MALVKAGGQKAQNFALETLALVSKKGLSGVGILG